MKGYYMNICMEKLEEFRKDVCLMHAEQTFWGYGNNEFSYYTFFNKRTGEFDIPTVSDSMNDTATTTTATYDSEDALAIAERLGEDEDLIWVWGHSHVDMGTTPSGRDKTTIQENNLELSVISNNKGDMKLLYNEGGKLYEINKHPTYSKVSGNTQGSKRDSGSNVQFSGYAAHYDGLKEY